MSFLSPWSLLWLASIPVLVWLWRLVSVRRRVVVPSLVPFEHLVARTPKRRGRLAVNALFWLQLGALAGLAAALAQPILFRPSAKLTLVILDTSASMTANDAFDRARRALLAHLAGKPPTAQVFVVATAPVLPLLPQPTSDALVLTRALEALRPSDLGGNLSTAERIGRALLAAVPDETLIVTDEPRPDPPPSGAVRWVSVGSPRPNVALVGLDAQGPLCRASDARVIATVQNFSGEAMPVAVRAIQGGRRLAEATVQLSPRERRSVSLAIPEGTEGQIELALDAPRDALALDNRAWLDVGRRAALPVVVRARAPEIRSTLAGWLGACQALNWTTDETRAAHPALVITDRADQVTPADAAALVFFPPADRLPVMSHWVVSPDHPVGAYLPSVVAVSATLNLAEVEPGTGVPVVWALVAGREFPVILANEREGRRMVDIRLDPSGSMSSTPLLLAFFNSLRWLMGYRDAQTPGEPLTASGFAPGPVRVHRPDGSTDTVESSGGTVRYEETTLSGRYRFVQGSREQSAAVNFFDPLESNLSERISTWRPLPDAVPMDHPPRPAAHPLASSLTILLLVLLLLEWWWYSTKQLIRVQGSGFRADVVAPIPEPRTPNPHIPVAP
ncbi:MAG: hypothetical protein A3C53_07530 [Omnitrophica WOR_2 bacterium RIFCSPHIGHO2_02_FULL_68_15]|nr:MAG: hypothetical protein A3C53_07530 [Omnitrophica WOR_2 bacterium RIFCSPHIGHO2_02_FULL_68_15]